MAILNGANTIAIRTRCGVGNFVIFSEQNYNILKKNNELFIITGTLNGTIKILHSPHVKFDNIIVGYKGTHDIDGGLVIVEDENDVSIVHLEYTSGYYKIIENINLFNIDSARI